MIFSLLPTFKYTFSTPVFSIDYQTLSKVKWDPDLYLLQLAGNLQFSTSRGTFLFQSGSIYIKDGI